MFDLSWLFRLFSPLSPRSRLWDSQTRSKLTLAPFALNRSAKDVAAMIIPTASSQPVNPDTPTTNSFTRFFSELSTLTRRGYNNTLRDRGSLLGVFAETILFALVMGGIFWQLPDDLASVRSMQTLLVMSVTAQNYLMMVSASGASEVWLIGPDVRDRFRPRTTSWSRPLVRLVPRLQSPPALTRSSTSTSFPATSNCSTKNASKASSPSPPTSSRASSRTSPFSSSAP